MTVGTLYAILIDEETLEPTIFNSADAAIQFADAHYEYADVLEVVALRVVKRATIERDWHE